MGSVSEVFVALVIADGKVTVSRRVPEVLKRKQERWGRKGGRKR